MKTACISPTWSPYITCSQIITHVAICFEHLSHSYGTLLNFCSLHFNWSTFFWHWITCALFLPQNCFTSLNVSVSDFHEDNAKCCSEWFSSVTIPGWYPAMARMTCVYGGDGLVTGDIVHDMYLYSRWWLSVHVHVLYMMAVCAWHVLQVMAVCTWTCTVGDGCLYMTCTVGDGSLYMTGTWRTTDNCQDILWGQKNWLELLRNWWSVNLLVISTLSPSALFSFLYSQDIEKVGKKNQTSDLKCRESTDVVKVHWDVRLSEHCWIHCLM